MGAREQYLDKSGMVVKNGDKCIYTHPMVWNKPGGEFHGELQWDRHYKGYFITDGLERYFVKFTYAGKKALQNGDLAKVVAEENDETLTPEELKELSLSWPELDYIDEPLLLAEELEDALE